MQLTIQITSFDNTGDLVNLLKTQAIEEAFILIKGSRGMKLERWLTTYKLLAKSSTTPPKFPSINKTTVLTFISSRIASQ